MSLQISYENSVLSQHNNYYLISLSILLTCLLDNVILVQVYSPFVTNYRYYYMQIDINKEDKRSRKLFYAFRKIPAVMFLFS